MLTVPTMLFLIVLGVSCCTPLSISLSEAHLGLGSWLMWWGPRDDDMYATAYFFVSLVLQVFLTTAIIIRLLKCSAQTKAILGETNAGHYSFLLVVFSESAALNVVCYLFFFVTSIPILRSERTAEWRSFRDIGFNVCLAITPAIQVKASPNITVSYAYFLLNRHARII